MGKDIHKYSEDFKKSVVNLYQNGKTQTQLCAEYGFPSSALSRWIKAYSQVKIDENTVMTAKQVKELQKRNALLEEETLCRVLRVNRSTYYKHFYGPAAPRSVENQQLRRKILKLYAESDKRLGAKKMQRRLKAEYDVRSSVGRVYRLMRGMQLPKMSTVKPPVRKRKRGIEEGVYKNLVKQEFNPQESNRIWASDITYVRVGSKFNYICVILDLFSRKVIAWRVGTRANSELVMETMEAAYIQRGCPDGVVFHSDRGTQYTPKKTRSYADERKLVQSFSAPGYPYDNAVVESFFKFFKFEELDRRKFEDIEELRRSAFIFIEGFYNSKRPHSANKGISPDEREEYFLGGHKDEFLC